MGSQRLFDIPRMATYGRMRGKFIKVLGKISPGHKIAHRVASAGSGEL